MPLHDGQVGCHRPAGRSVIDRPHWSYSQISQFLRCPLQYFFERVARVPKAFTSSGMVLGASVHHALAAYHRSLQSQADALATSRLCELVVQKWDETEGREAVQYRDGEDRTKLVDQAVALVSLYAREPIPQCVVAVEEPLLVPLCDSRGEVLEKPLLAIPDLITRDGTGLRITEFKTSGRRYGELEAEGSHQASCYAHAVQDRYGEEPRIRYTILVKTKTPQIQHLETVRNDADVSRLGDIVQAIDQAIEAEIFFPIESPMNCSGCPFFKPCREWQGGSRSRVPVHEASREALARC